LRWLLRKCARCGRYTLRRDRCPVCGGPVVVPHPPRFSPEDKYVAYRYRLKMLAAASSGAGGLGEASASEPEAGGEPGGEEEGSAEPGSQLVKPDDPVGVHE